MEREKTFKQYVETFNHLLPAGMDTSILRVGYPRSGSTALVIHENRQGKFASDWMRASDSVKSTI